MYQGKSIAVIIPAYNEEQQLPGVLNTMPDFVDRIVVVDDGSSDQSKELVLQWQEKDDRITLLEHEQSQGCGGAMATGYKWVRDHDYDVAVRMDGDGQMDPVDLPRLLEPVTSDEADFSKGNRFYTGEAYEKMPKIRYFGNAILSLLTKIASGYWHVADSQSGYVVLNREVLHTLDWDSMYPSYGQPNDLLVMLNIYDFRVRDVIIKPVYGVGETSRMKIRKVVFSVGWNLFKRFLWRLKEKYVIRNFHPLVFFYAFSFFFGALTIPLFLRIFYIWLVLGGQIPKVNALAAMFSMVSTIQFSLFAMWFDMKENKMGSERRSSDLRGLMEQRYTEPPAVPASGPAASSGETLAKSDGNS